MKHHPVVIITSHPEGMTQAIKKLEQDGFEVKVLDSLSANLIDFFGAISQSDPEMFGAVSDNTGDPDEELSAIADPNEESDEAPTDAGVVSPDVEPSTGDEVGPSDEVIFSGTLNDETVEIHEVEGSEIILHPVSVEGSGSKIKFNLSESIEMTLWESKEEGSEELSEELSEVEVHLVIPDLEVDATVKIKISEMTMNPPVILMGRDWYASFQSTSVEKTA